MADRAPPMVVAFIYYMTRDLLPPRYTESVVAFLRSHPDPLSDPDLRAYAERKARELCYEPTSVGQ